MARLPQPGGDDGTWGDVLNDFLAQSHNADGSLKPINSSSVSGLASVATSGSYTDLTNKPTNGVAAPTGVASTDTANIQNAINAGGVCVLQPGTYVVNGLLIASNVTVRGAGIGATTIKLANGANADLVTVANFGALTGNNGSGGATKFAFENLTLDGNGANQSGTSWTFRVYGYNYRINDVELVNGYSGNAYSEWGNASGGDMEAIWSRFKLLSPVSSGAVNLDWNGPHDSIFTDGIVVAAGAAGPSGIVNQIGIYNRGNAGGEAFTNVHVWGFHLYSMVAEHTFLAQNCTLEGAYNINLLLRTSKCRFDGRIFGTNGTHLNEIGVQIGDTGFTNIMGSVLDITTFNWDSTAKPINFQSSGGRNRVTGTGMLGGATQFAFGSINSQDNVNMLLTDGTIDQNSEQTGRPLRIYPASNTALQVGLTPVLSVNTNNTFAVDVPNSSKVRGYTGNYTGQTYQLDGANGAIQPGTAAGGLGARVFSGSGAPTFSAIAGDYYLRTDTPGTPAQRLYICTGTTNWSPFDSRTTDVQVFTSNGTWTKPTGAVSVNVMCIGGGGGGGSGGRFASGQVPCGGGGGGGASITQTTLSAGVLPATVAVTIGNGGIGGVAVTTDSTAGNSALGAGSTTFGSFLVGNRGGAGGGGGNGIAGAAGSGGGGLASGGPGAASSATGGAGPAAASGNGCPGGGAGGGIIAAGTASNGGNGSVSNLQSGGTSPAGGTAGAGQDGTAGTASTINSYGFSGGGGASNASAGAGNGGVGGLYGAGGGGGGASLNGFASGKGGNGANGICVVVTTF